MKIIFFGSAGFGIPCLEALADSTDQLVHIFTQPARPAGRGKNPKPTPVANWALERSIPCTETADINTPQMIEALVAHKADLLVVIAFGQKISRQVIDLFPKGAINVHSSLLPKYRGAAPINHALINGETETGISIITLADRMDAGNVLDATKMTIEKTDTAETIGDKLALTAPALLTETIDKIAADTAVYVAQDESKVTLARKLKKSDGFIDWSESSESIVNKIRGLCPWPGVQTDYLSNKTKKQFRVTIQKAQSLEPQQENQPPFGAIDNDLNVICGSGKLKILQIKPAGGRVMDFKDFVNGRHVTPDDMFMTIDKAD